MTAKAFIHTLTYLEPVFCCVALLAIIRSGAAKKFVFLTSLLSVRLFSGLICLTLLKFSGRGIEKHFAYDSYFYTYWLSYAAEAMLSLLLIYSIFKLAMTPLKGLATLGILVFRWAGAISVAIAIGMAVGPHESGVRFMVAMVTQLQQITSILTLCLLLFVCFAIRPMGLNYQSRIFGVSLGLGMMATISLMDAAWLSRNPQMFSTLSVLNGISSYLALFIWSAYFTMPEPKRRIIVLPTTSPYLRWNQISMALGDEPGYVAVGGIPPEIFAPAEIEVMLRASAKMSTGTGTANSPGIANQTGLISRSA